MSITRKFGEGVLSRGASSLDADFTLASNGQVVIVSPSETSDVTVEDIVYERYTSSTYYNNYSLIVVMVISDGSTIAFESLDTDIATVNSNGFVTRVSDGTVGILASSRLLTKRIDLDVSTVGPEIIETFKNWVVGSLAEDCSVAVDSRIAGKTKASNGSIFTSQDHAGGVYVRNTDVWCSDLDLTCLSPWNNSANNKTRRTGTLISPRHVAMAAHYPIDIGATVRFVTMDNVVVERTLSARETVSGTDISIGLLNEDVPETITFAKIPPADIDDYFANLSLGMPCLCLDQEEKALVTDLYSINSLSIFKAPIDTQRLEFYEPKIDGDSGGPGFLIIDDELCLVVTWTYGGAGSGPCYPHKITEINSVMTSLGGGYTITTKDLSGYPTYT